MKKIRNRVFMTAAAVVMAGSWTIPAQGAYVSFPVSGGGVVIAGGSGLDGLENWKDLADRIGAVLGENCGNWQPGRPEEPEIPNWPGTPEIPDRPGTPEIPDRPETPEIPDRPETPGEPNRPEEPNQPEIPDRPGSGETGTVDEFAAEVVRLVNQEREKAGLSPLTVNAQAAEAAQVRAGEIEYLFSHTRPDGTSFVTALQEAGVSYRGAGENIAYGQKTPEQVMEGWMNSQGHRANILNPNFTAIGVGHYQNSRGVSYWTQLFVR